MIVSVSDLGIRLILIAIACLFFGQSPGNLFYLAPLAGLVLILTANALGLVLAVPGSFFPDISKTIQSISLGLFLVSPVFYSVPSDKESTLYILNQFNPFGVVLTAFHSIAYGTDPLMLIPWLIWVICLALLVPLLILYFRAVGPLIIERL
jgi:ABC-type polysaccharide/polyol phosphate export permease